MAVGKISIYPDRVRGLIDPKVYGHFIEHLWTCIYDGIWVGLDSEISNIQGIRRDVVEALRRIEPPIIRWPGGYFAELYNWVDGVGPRESRPVRVCPTQPNGVETNQFGTDEFIRLCRLVGAEPNICVNTSIITPREAGFWVEYCNRRDTDYAKLRVRNGNPEPYNVKYWSIGNECYFMYPPVDYATRYLNWRHFMRNADPTIECIACGIEPIYHPKPWALGDWGEEVVKMIQSEMEYYSVHVYFSSGSEDKFSDEEYYHLFAALENRLTSSINRVIGILDYYTQGKNVKIALDEWGVWHPGHDMKGNMTQKCTLRDALFTACFFNILHRYPSKIGMANVAQTVNVCHSLIITDGGRMFLTPTYHVFDLYRGFKGSQSLEIKIESETFKDPLHRYTERKIPHLSASAAKSGNGLIVSLVNLNLDEEIDCEVELRGSEVIGGVRRILTSRDVRDVNSFETPNRIMPKEEEVKIRGEKFTEKLYPHTLTVLELKTH